MKNKKGFTLIELLAVVIILGLLIAIAFPAISKYTNEARNDTYSLHEAELKTATANMMSKCLQGNIDGCVPDSGGSRTVYLNELVAQKFSSEIKDPANTEKYCDADKTYVVVTNSKNNVVDLDYQVCLVCSKYQSAVCETVSPDNKCDKETDPERPVCGDAVGTSTIWTNADRIISIGCSDTGCGCTQSTYYQRFNETAKQGVITVVDKAGNSTDCVVDVYVDKDPPKCELEIIGTLGENGWYGGPAPVVRFKTDPMDGDKLSGSSIYSGVSTYGIGLSSRNYDLNKETSYTISPGITTVYGYVKDNAGNVGICQKEVKYDNVVPTSDVTYGYQVYPKEDIATVSGKTITLNSFISEYGNVLGANIYLKSNTSGMSVTIYKGSAEVAKRTISAGVTSMMFSFTGTYSGITIDMGSASNVALVERVELLTDHTNGFYTNQDVYVYATSQDSFSGKGYYSFDDGTWQTSNMKIYTGNVTSANVRTKDFAGNVSDKVDFSVNNIDKDKPECTVSTDFAPNGKNGWFTKNFGLTLNKSDGKQTGNNVISSVRDYNLTTSSTPSYTAVDTATQTQDTKLTTWRGYIRDKAGNVNTCSINVKLDKVKPTCELSSSGEKGDNNWYISDVIFTYTTNDDTSGVKYKDITDSTEHSIGGTTSITMDFDTTSKTYYCHVEDEAGLENFNTITEKRDTVKPTCVITRPNPDGDNGWWRNNVTLSFATTDATSNIAGYDFTTATTANYTGKHTSATVSTSTPGITYYGYTKDNAGHTNSCYETVKLDKDNPTCTLEPQKVDGNNGWYISNIVFTLKDSDATDTSGIIETGIVNTNTVTYNGKKSVTHTADGTGIIYYAFVKDESGRTGSCQSATVKKDATKPAACELVVKSGTLGNNNWYTSNVTIGLKNTPSDALSDIYGYDIAPSNPNYLNKASTFVVTDDSVSSSGSVYNAYIRDNAGNVRTCSITVKKDTNVDCSIDFNGDMGINNWYISNTVGVNLDISNDISGMAEYGLSTNYISSANNISAITHTGNAYYDWYYAYVKDNAGNSKRCSNYLNVDTESPKCTIEVTDGVLGENNWYISDVVKLTLTPTDTGYSRARNYYITTIDTPVYGTKTVAYQYGDTTPAGVMWYGYVRDGAGHTAQCNKPLKKDSTDPYCSLSITSGAKGKNSWYVSNVRLDMYKNGYNTYTGSPIAKYTITNSETINWSTVTYNSSYYDHKTDTKGITYYCHVKDQAGNSYTNSSPNFKVDLTKPTCKIQSRQNMSGTICGSTDWSSASSVTYEKRGLCGYGSVDIEIINQSDKTSGVSTFGIGFTKIPVYNATESLNIKYDLNGSKVYGYVKDEAGNEGNCYQTINKIGGTGYCSIVAKGTTGDNDWYTSDVELTLSMTSESGKTLSWNSDYMTFKNASTGIDFGGFTGKITTNGQHAIEGRYYKSGFWVNDDFAGCDLAVKVDKKAPTIVSVTRSPNSDYTSENSITVTVKASEGANESGIAYWYYRDKGSTEWLPRLGSYGDAEYDFVYYGEGDYTRYYKVCDKAGNCSETKEATVAKIEYCDNPPANAKKTFSACSTSCGEGTQSATIEWTSENGVKCKIEQTNIACSSVKGCSTASTVCKKGHDALFGTEIGQRKTGETTNNWGSYSRVNYNTPGVCQCTNGTTSMSLTTYEKVCYSSSACGDYLGFTLTELINIEYEEYLKFVEYGGNASDYEFICPTVSTLQTWCSCQENKSDDYKYVNGVKYYLYRPFVADVLAQKKATSGFDYCTWLTPEEKEGLIPGVDSCV